MHIWRDRVHGPPGGLQIAQVCFGEEWAVEFVEPNDGRDADAQRPLDRFTAIADTSREANRRMQVAAAACGGARVDLDELHVE